MNRRSFLGGGLEALAMAGTSSAAASASAAPAAEEPIDPSWPIIDAHHHLWDFPARGGNPPRRFMLSDLLKEIDAGGHHITQTVAVECMSTYRADGPPELRSLGETEFVTGIAAQSASGNYGPCRVAAGFVGFVDLRLGEAAKPSRHTSPRRGVVSRGSATRRPGIPIPSWGWRSIGRASNG
jgi:hypothetical protein